MKLHFENICKISSADVDLDGITIVAGNNETGKSTVGKVLFAMFESLADLPEKTFSCRSGDCYTILKRSFPTYLETQAVVRGISNRLATHESSVKEAIEALKKLRMGFLKSQSPEPDWDYIERKLNEILGISDKDYQSQIVFDFFNDVFKNNYIPRVKNPGIPFAKMLIKGKELSLRFYPELPEIVHQLALNNKPYFFDSPAQLEELNSISKRFTAEQFKRVANGYKQENSVAESILFRRKFEEIGNGLTEILEGKIVYDESSGFQFESPKLTKKLNLENLSQGAKAIALLQTAFSKGAIKDGDVLILDEPEIHLHPEWQVKYAEFIVLLQKAFHLTVLLTSHSPDFVEAIRLYSRKHGLDGKLNGYVTVLQEDGRATLEKVPDDDWDRIFTKFADSFRMLMKLRDELEEGENG